MTPFLECKSIFKTFGGINALVDINLRVGENTIIGIIGPNGAGKTTLFNIISGAMRPTSGEVIFEGRKISKSGAARVCRMGIARTYQLVRPFHSLTAIENVLIGLGFGRFHPPSKMARIEEAIKILEFVGLGEKVNHAAEGLTLVEKKHLEIARALATSPDILLLDEVVSGLNPTEVSQIIDTIQQIRASGVTLIMIEHILKVVMELCDRVMVLNYGVQIAQGTPEEVVSDSEVVNAYIGKFEDTEEKRDA